MKRLRVVPLLVLVCVLIISCDSTYTTKTSAGGLEVAGISDPDDWLYYSCVRFSGTITNTTTSNIVVRHYDNYRFSDTVGGYRTLTLKTREVRNIVFSGADVFEIMENGVGVQKFRLVLEEVK